MTQNRRSHDYDRRLKLFARHLRKNSTKAEIRMWTELLRAKKMLGYPFLRQRPILNYIADFYCKKWKLIIEVDGFSHDDPEAIERDKKRDRVLSGAGYHILRFTDYEVINELPFVQQKIEKWILRKEEETNTQK